MRWPWHRRTASTLGDIQVLVAREVERRLAVELSPLPVIDAIDNAVTRHEGMPVRTQTARQRPSRLTAAINDVVAERARDAIAAWVRACVTCGQPFLVPRAASGPSDPMMPQPTDERRCAVCRQDLPGRSHGVL